MSMVEQLETSLARELNGFAPGLGDLDRVTTRGRQIRHRRRVAVAALVAIVAAVAGASAWSLGTREPRPADGGAWRPTAPAPLSPRSGALAGWTGSEALFIGGSGSGPCSSGSPCTDMKVDGAAYDPTTDSWRRIAPSPVPMRPDYLHVMAGDTMLVQADHGLYAYDAGTDQWRAVPPPGPPYSLALDADADHAYAFRGNRFATLLQLDLSTDRWESLPADDLQPQNSGARIAVGAGVLYLGGVPVEMPRGELTRDVVDQWDGQRWTRLLTTEQVDPSFHWTGERLVDPRPGTAESVRGNPPFGGIVDPSTRTWSPLPSAPGAVGDGWQVEASDGPLFATSGYVYDDTHESWTTLGRPDGADADTDLAAVWAAGRLVVLGGADGRSVTDQAWVWTP